MPPRVLAESPPPADERVAYGDHPSQFIDFRRPVADGSRPLAIVIHGGFWRARYNLLHAGHLCAALCANGFASANIEYRRTGESGGGWPGTFDDVTRAANFARDHAPAYGGDPSRTVVLGHSAGGHLALWLAAEIPELAGVIGLAPVASLRDAFHLALSANAAAELMGGSPTEVPERYLAADPARPAAVPRVIVHGTADETVPIALSRAYAAPAHLIEIPDADHFAVIDPLHAAWATVLQQVRLLAAGGRGS
jgi:acetyl esterase/lipase